MCLGNELGMVPEDLGQFHMRLLEDYEHIEHVERCRARERRLGFFSKCRCVEESTAIVCFWCSTRNFC